MFLLKDCLKDVEHRVLTGDIENIELEDVVYDSRKAGDKNIFVCLKGLKVDSHKFIPDVIKNGCRVIVTEENSGFSTKDMDIPSDTVIIETKSSRHALSMLSEARFNYPSKRIKVIAITGTKGKTTTAFMIKKILETAGYKVGLIGTNGIEYLDVHEKSANTTPESYMLSMYFDKMIEAGCEYAIIEASSQGFKMHRTDAIKFEYGIFTNIEPDHIGPGEHKDFEEYKYFKSMIFNQSNIGLINLDADYADEILRDAPCKMFTYAIKRTADFMANNVEYKSSDDFMGMEFDISGHAYIDVLSGLPGYYNVYNALSAASVASLEGVNEKVIKKALKHMSVAGRCEIAFKNSDITVLVDYAHNEMATRSLIETLKHYNAKRIVLVFGCGGNRAKDRRYGMGKVAAMHADFSILTADNSRFEKTSDIISDIKISMDKYNGKYIEIEDREEAIEYALRNSEKGDLIAVIGKGHEDYNEANGKRTHFSDREAVIEAAKKAGLKG